MPAYLETAYFYHTACVLQIEENPTSTAEAPPTILVDLVTFDSGGVEVGRAEGVVLALDSNDGDPNSLRYHSDLATPIIFVEGTMATEMLSNVIILEAPENGTAIAIERAP